MTRNQASRHWRVLRAAIRAAVIAVATHACESGGGVPVPEDARVVLQAHISHGIGDSPFDSPMVHDSIAALLIVHARDCAEVESLQSHYTDSARSNRLIERLRSDNLLKDRGDDICTTFPILVGDGRNRYAALTGAVAARAHHDLAADWAAILQLVRDRGWHEWQYHFIWSQLFDSQFAWTEMMTRGLVPPLSHLIAWVVFPDHTFRSGTNYYPDTELRDYWLMTTWRAGGANTTEAVSAQWDVLYRAGLYGDPLKHEDRGRLSSWGVVDATGTLRVPVLHRQDPLYELLKNVSRRYVAYLEQRMPLDRLLRLSGADDQAAFAMAYHDVSWGVIERLVSSGEIETPPPLRRRNGNDAATDLRGVFALTEAYPPFIDMIRAAIQGL